MSDSDQDVKNQLLAVDGIEGFIQSGRIPILTDPIEGVDRVVIIVPPEGTQRGDSYRTLNYMDAIARGDSPEGMGDMGTIEFLSPERQSRGLCEIVTLTMQEYEILRERRMRAIKQYNTETREPGLLPSFSRFINRK